MANNVHKAYPLPSVVDDANVASMVILTFDPVNFARRYKFTKMPLGLIDETFKSVDELAAAMPGGNC